MDAFRGRIKEAVGWCSDERRTVAVVFVDTRYYVIRLIKLPKNRLTDEYRHSEGNSK
jgi:hypothetical protein